MTMTTICIHLFHHFIPITLLLLYNIAIIDFLEELAYVRRRCNKKKKREKKEDSSHMENVRNVSIANFNQWVDPILSENEVLLLQNAHIFQQPAGLLGLFWTVPSFPVLLHHYVTRYSIILKCSQ